VWTYGIELWGTASTSNIEILEPIESFAHGSERTVVRAEYGYPKGSPYTNSKEDIRRYSSQYSASLT
jgi:hypothetical protein